MEPKYFSLFEFLHSDTAYRKHIENFPSFQIVENLKELGFFLDGIREAWGSGICVNSGYRCPQLNDAVGGSETSAHMIGFGVDIVPKNGKFEEFKKFVIEYLKDKAYDQCLIEQSGNARWIHIGLYNNKGQQRKQCFELKK